MTRSRCYQFVAIISILLVAVSASLATEIYPGRIFNPGGLQMFMSAAYNSAKDEYLLISAGISSGLWPQALLIHMKPDGTVPGGVTVISPDIPVNEVDVAYNPDRNEYLAVWRYDQPIDIWGIYLDGDGNAIGSGFPIAASGDHETEAKVEYSTGSQDYIVVWQEKPAGMSWYRIEYRMIDGDSTAVTPYVGGTVTIESNAWDPDVSYGSVSDKFLVVFTTETAAKDEIYGRFVASNGSGFLSGVIPIVSGDNNQNQANLAYAPSTDRWLVTLSDWTWAASNSSDALAVLINNAGVAVAANYIAATPKEPVSGGWDAAGPVTYNAAVDKFFASWRIEPRTYGREVSPVDASLGPPVFFSDENAGPLGIASREVPSGPQYMLMWRNGQGADGVHAGIINLAPTTYSEAMIDMEMPTNGLKTLLPFNVSGFAIDTAAPSGSGIDLVQITATPTSGSEQVIGQVTSFTSRPDVAATYGAQFEFSGFSFDVTTGLANGEYSICAKARSTVTGFFEAEDCATVDIGPDVQIGIDEPLSGATVEWPFQMTGWAVDPVATTGTGVDLVHIWAFPSSGGTPTFVTGAIPNRSRPDVASVFGDPRFEPSGFSVLSPNPLPNGDYTLRVYARSTVTNTWEASSDVSVTVLNETLVSIDQPPSGTSLFVPFELSGWAVNAAAPSGTGVDMVHVWAFPTNGGSPIFLGGAIPNQSSPDVATWLGDPRFGNAGFRLQVSMPLPLGTYIIRAYARSTVSGTFDMEDFGLISLTFVAGGSDPRMTVEDPINGDAVTTPFTVTGWAIDLGAATGAGVDLVHVWAFPTSGGSPFFIGGAFPTIARPDVEATFGSQFLNCGFEVYVVTPMSPGAYTLRVYARSTVTGTFNNSFNVSVTVP